MSFQNYRIVNQIKHHMKKLLIVTLAILSIGFSSCSSLAVSLVQVPYDKGQVGVVRYINTPFGSMNAKRRALAMDKMRSVCPFAQLVREYQSTESAGTGSSSTTYRKGTEYNPSGSFQTSYQQNKVNYVIIEFKCP